MPMIFSFFSGIGMLDNAFEEEGFEVVYSSEIYKPFLDGYKHVRKSLSLPEPMFGYHMEDIRSLKTGTHIKRIGRLLGAAKKLDLVGFIGGPPCPDFSVGGKNLGRYGPNGHLSKVYVDLISIHQPDFFVFENVKGLWKTQRHRVFYEELKKQLENSGYALADRLVNSLEFGAPQDRDRVILVGIRRELVCASLLDFAWTSKVLHDKKKTLALPWPTKNPPSRERHQAEGIPVELTVNHWFKRNIVTEHPNSGDAFLPRAGLNRFIETWEGDTSRKSFKRLHRWRYSPTAAYGNNEVHIHPWEPRRISVAEALAIQSAPASFSLPQDMSLTAMFKGIGNAVPYLLGKGIASPLHQLLKASDH